MHRRTAASVLLVLLAVLTLGGDPVDAIVVACECYCTNSNNTDMYVGTYSSYGFTVCSSSRCESVSYRNTCAVPLKAKMTSGSIVRIVFVSIGILLAVCAAIYLFYYYYYRRRKNNAYYQNGQPQQIYHETYPVNQPPPQQQQAYNMQNNPQHSYNNNYTNTANTANTNNSEPPLPAYSADEKTAPGPDLSEYNVSGTAPQRQ